MADDPVEVMEISTASEGEQQTKEKAKKLLKPAQELPWWVSSPSNLPLYYRR